MKKALLLAMAVFILAGTASAARIPHMINIQGSITETATGAPYNGSITLTAEPASADVAQLSYISIPTGAHVQDTAVDPQGFVWAANFGNQTVSRIDPATNTVTDTISLNNQGENCGCVEGIDIDPMPGNYASVACFGAPSGLGCPGAVGSLSSVKVINLFTKTQTHTITGGGISQAHDVVDVGGGYGFVTNFNGNTVTRISLITHLPVGSPYPVGSEPRGIAVAANKDIWVANGSSNSVSQRVAIGTYSQLITIPMPFANSTPVNLAIDSSGYVWVAELTRGEVAKIVPGIGVVYNVTLPGSAGSSGIAVDPKDNTIWVREKAATGRIYRIKQDYSVTVMGTLPVGDSDVATLTYGNNSFWTGDYQTDSVARIIYNYGDRPVTVTGGRFNQLVGPFTPTISSTDSYKINVKASIPGTSGITINDIPVAAPDMP